MLTLKEKEKMGYNERSILRKIRRIAGLSSAGKKDIIPDNFIGDEIPDPCRPFCFWSPYLQKYVHVIPKNNQTGGVRHGN
jgi:hypothetical protein